MVFTLNGSRTSTRITQGVFTTSFFITMFGNVPLAGFDDHAGLGGFRGNGLGQPGSGLGFGFMDDGLDSGCTLTVGPCPGAEAGRPRTGDFTATGAPPAMGAISGASGMHGMPGTPSTFGQPMYDEFVARFDPLRMHDKPRGAQNLLSMMQADPAKVLQRLQVNNGDRAAEPAQGLVAECRKILGQGDGRRREECHDGHGMGSGMGAGMRASMGAGIGAGIGGGMRGGMSGTSSHADLDGGSFNGPSSFRGGHQFGGFGGSLSPGEDHAGPPNRSPFTELGGHSCDACDGAQGG